MSGKWDCCGSKIAYDSQGAAAKAARSTLRRNGFSGRQKTDRALRPYLCPHCGKWHIGHKPARVR